MSFLAIPLSPSLPVEITPEGDLLIDGRCATSGGGWIRLPVSDVAPAAPPEVLGRVWLRRDADYPVLVLEQLRIGRMRYAGPASLTAIEGAPWQTALGSALQLALKRVLLARLGLRVHAGQGESEEAAAPGGPARPASGTRPRVNTAQLAAVTTRDDAEPAADRVHAAEG